MKLGCLLLLVLISSLNAQEVIHAAPLELTPEDGKTISKGEAPIGTLVPANVEINPVDGQLKLEDKKPTPAASAAVAPAPTVSAEASTALIPEVTEVKYNHPQYETLQKYLQVSFGYLNSKWDKADQSLDNGSLLTDFRVASDMNFNNQLGFAIEMLQDTSGSSAPENIRIVQYKLFLDHHRELFKDKVDWLVGAAFSVGDFSIRKLSLNGSGQEVYTKIKSGTIYGIIPSAGLRFYLVGKSSFDIAVEYHQYFSKPQRYIGGFANIARLSLVF